jgi:hypothetical protein
MSTIDDIWASMNDDYVKTLPQKKKSVQGSKAVKAKQPLSSMVHGTETMTVQSPLLPSTEVKKIKKKITTTTSTTTLDDTLIVETVSAATFMNIIARDVQALSESDMSTRKRALIHLHLALTEKYQLATDRDYNSVFHDLSKPLFKRFADPVEKCRELSHQITQFFFGKCQDLVPVLGYYFPALMQRQPTDIGYDEELKIFVLDKESHLAFKRGKAVERQDKIGSPDVCHVTHVESSEEIRYASIQALVELIKRAKDLDCMPILHPYFEDIMIILQLSVHDANPETKVLTCEALELMARIPDFEMGFKYYSVALVRTLFPQLKHRQHKVRFAVLGAVHHIMIVPDRAKRKASGSEAITDMIGFREENVLPIAAFYRPDVSFNYLAELVSDKSSLVRERLVSFLNSLLTQIDDRYDHQTRLLPYLLDLLTDEIPSIAQAALQCLKACGKEYEEEHFDEIIVKKQYNVDGDQRINLSKPLPAPFTETGRPSIGIRLYVRGNTKRFLHALVNELTNWVAHTRLKSANLMKMVIILCEEHLTMEAHTLLPALIKALRFARDDQDIELQTSLMEVYELMGRYVLPEIYLYYILPRLRGDPDVVAFGLDNETRITVMIFLQCFLSGSKANQIIPFFDDLVNTLTNGMLFNFVDSQKLSSAIVDIMDILVQTTMQDKGGQNVIEAFYMTTGRLSSLQLTIRKMFNFLLTISCLFPELQSKALSIVKKLSSVEGSNGTMFTNDVQRLFFTHSTFLYRDILQSNYDVDCFRNSSVIGMATTTSIHQQLTTTEIAIDSQIIEHQLLQRLLCTPWYSIQTQPVLIGEFISFVKKVLLHDIQQLDGILECESQLYMAVSQLFLVFCLPIYSTEYDIRQKSTAEFFQILSNTALPSHVLRRAPGLLSKSFNSNIAQQSMATLNVHCEDLLELLVYNYRWSSSIALATRRLLVVALLSGQYNDMQLLMFPQHDDDRYEDSEEEDNQDNALFPLLTEQCKLLIKHFSQLVKAMIPFGLAPTTPKLIRLATVRLFKGMLETIKVNTSLTKLRPFSFWTKSENKINSVQLQAKSCVQLLIQSLLTSIQDSDDDVRIEIVQTLTAVIPLLLPDDIALSLPDTPVTFSFMVHNLMRDLLVEIQCTASSSLSDHLDAALRSLAVLDPITFETVVRAEFAVNGVDASGTSKKADVVNDLINHADLLSTMASSH